MSEEYERPRGLHFGWWQEGFYTRESLEDDLDNSVPGWREMDGHQLEDACMQFYDEIGGHQDAIVEAQRCADLCMAARDLLTNSRHLRFYENFRG